MGDGAAQPSSSVPPTEAALVAALKAGDAAAFERLVRSYGGRLLLVARQILASDADAADALQDALLTAFRSMGSFEGKSQLSTWLHRVTVNAALMRLRSRKRKREQPIDELLPKFKADGHQQHPCRAWNQSALSGIEQKETQALVRTCIDQLPADYRTVIVLRDIQELDTATVAEMLGLTEGNVKVRLHRARQALRTLLDPLFGTPEGP
jgi:RNA polymerase sigma-70 factor, ECF subfamily